MSTRIAVLASGRGSNARALIEYQESLGELRAGHVAIVISDRADAPVLDIARRHGLAAVHLASHQDGDELLAHLDGHGVELLVLAGYLRLVPSQVVSAFAGRIVNVHPALLPAFGGKGMFGRRLHQAVLDSGARVTGVTVHFVDEEYDRGAIVAQWPVPIRAGDSAESLAGRVLAVEHLLFPRAVEAVAASRIRLGDDGRVVGAFAALPIDAAFTLVAADNEVLGRQIASALTG